MVLLGALGICLHSHALAQAYPKSVDELVASAKAQIKTIDLAKFKAALDNNDGRLIIDVREPGEYAAGHIPGAINVPRGVIELRVWPHVGYPANVDFTKTLLLYCQTGVRNVLAAKSLQELGFTNVIAADIRVEDWTKAGHPLVKQ